MYCSRRPSPGEARTDPQSGGGRPPTLGRMLGLPVTVVAVIAEKRVPLGQLTTFLPGAIIQFEKRCEDPLDLCVKRRKIATGEAVRVGENFGLRITGIGRPEAATRGIGGGKGEPGASP